MQSQNLYKSSSKQTIQTICILIHMISFNFVLIIKKSDALHEHILHKIGVLFGLNSKTQMSVYCKTDLLIYAESLYTGRYFFNITNETKNSPCDYGFCIIYIVNRDRKIIVYDKTTNNVYVNTRMDSGTAWIRWRKA